MAGVVAVAGPHPVTTTMLRRNRLLAVLPGGEQDRLQPELELVELKMRDTLYEVDQPVSQVYFPLDCVISEVAMLDDDTPVEVATIGMEGMAGLPVFLGAVTSPNQSFCQVPGQALALNVARLRRFLTTDGALHDLLHRYTQTMMVFLSQNVACNRLHSTEQRCARWLAQTRDRVSGNNFPMTQEFLVAMLGSADRPCRRAPGSCSRPA